MKKNFQFYSSKHINGISSSLKEVDIQQAHSIINILDKNNGVIFFTGVGKNGHVAAKAASTFNSASIDSYYINPIDAVHGDMGIIKKNDILLAVSKSGNTEELVFFLKNVRSRTKNILLLHSNLNNQSLKYCYKDLFIPIRYEADHLNKIPTISIAIYSIILQSFCCVLADKNKFCMKDLILNHPGGSIGKTKI